MKNKFLLILTLVALLLSSLFIMGCDDEDDKKDPTGPVIENPNDISPNYVDRWDLYENVENERGELVLIQMDYLVVNNDSIVVNGVTLGNETTESVFFTENQIGLVNIDETVEYLYDFYFNDETQTLWLTENTTPEVYFAVDPTVTDSVEIDSVMVEVNVEDYKRLYRASFNTNVRLKTPLHMSYIPNQEDINEELENASDEAEALEILSKSLNVRLDWEAYPNADLYTVQLGTDPQFQDENAFLVNDETSSVFYGTDNNPVELQNNTNYYWRIKSDNSAWSETRTIRARNVEFQDFPYNEASTSRLPNFRWWGNIDGVTNYTFEISRIREFNTSESFEVTGTTFTPADTLDANTTYYWRVSNNLSDVPSSTFEFKTNKKAKNVYPANGDDNFMPDHLEWEPLDNAASYYFQIATDSTFVDIAFDGNSEDVTYELADGDIEPNTLYYWRVTTSVASSWSDVTNFTTNVSPFLDSPADGATNVGVIKRFTWDGYDGVADYRLQVSEDVDFATTVLDTVVAHETEPGYTSVNDMEFSKTYYWRVAAGDLDFLGQRSFSTAPADYQDQVIIESPVNEATNLNLTPKFEWVNNTSDFYNLLVATDADFNNIIVDEVRGETSYTLSESQMLQFNNTYYAKVLSSYSTEGGVIEFSTRTGVPVNFQANALSEFKVDFSWNDVSSNENGFEIFKSNSADGEYTSIGTVDEDETRFAEFNLAAGQTYFYKVLTMAETGNSALSAAVQVQITDFVQNNVPMMKDVAAGNFQMGDANGEEDEQAVHPVTLTNDFQMSETEVTNAQFCEILNWLLGKGKIKNIEGYTFSSNFADDAISFDALIREEGETKFAFDSSTKTFVTTAGYENHPVEDVTVFAAALYANALGEIEGLTALYEGTTSLSSTVYGTAGYRLPTEAEWEYVAKYNDGRTYPWGNDDPTADKANYYVPGTNNDTSEAGSLVAGNNSLGIADLAGNVWEWCNDIYDAEYYTDEAVENPTGPSGTIGNSTAVVIRGGSYQYSVEELRNSNRSRCKANLTVGRVTTGIGFRLVKIN